MLKKTAPVLFKLGKRCATCFIISVTFYTQVTKAADRLLLDKVVATVNEEPIFYSDLQEICNQLALEGKVVNEAMTPQILRELVLSKLFLAKAKLDNLKLPQAFIEKECSSEIANLVRHLGSEAKLVEAAGQPIHELKKAIKKRIKAQQLALLVHQNLTKNILIKSEDIETYFNQLLERDRYYYPTAVEVYELLVYPKVDKEQAEGVKKKLLNLKQSILDGLITFGQAAKEHSDDPYSAANGGEHGYLSLGKETPAYRSAALSLKVGQISDPVASEFGWHLIKLISRNKDQYNTCHIFKSMQPTNKNIKLAEIEANKIRDGIITRTLTFQESIHKYSENNECRVEGGLVKARNQNREALPSLLVSTHDLDEKVYFAIHELEVGGVTKPEYTSDPYKPAWRLYYLKQKVEAHQLNIDDDYEKLHNYLLNQKKEEAVKKWITKAKSEFVIEFSPEYEAVKALL